MTFQRAGRFCWSSVVARSAPRDRNLGSAKHSPPTLRANSALSGETGRKEFRACKVEVAGRTLIPVEQSVGWEKRK